MLGTYNNSYALFNNTHPHYTTHKLPTFGSAKERKANTLLQAAATEYIDNIVRSHINDTFIWTDGSVHRGQVTSAGTACVISHGDTVTHTASLKLDTTSIAIAELSGIAFSLLWLHYTQPQLSSSIHILADNQYAINACQSLCRVNPKHVSLVTTIRQSLHSLQRHYTIQFHWIPSHTDNPLHSHADALANDAAFSTRSCIDPYRQIAMFTDVPTSGWEWPSP